jgi:hypothetical protein
MSSSTGRISRQDFRHNGRFFCCPQCFTMTSEIFAYKKDPSFGVLVCRNCITQQKWYLCKVCLCDHISCKYIRNPREIFSHSRGKKHKALSADQSINEAYTTNNQVVTQHQSSETSALPVPEDDTTTMHINFANSICGSRIV